MGFHGVSYCLSDLFRFHIFLMWIGRAVIYLFLVLFARCTMFIDTLNNTTDNPIIQNFY